MLVRWLCKRFKTVVGPQIHNGLHEPSSVERTQLRRYGIQDIVVHDTAQAGQPMQELTGTFSSLASDVGNVDTKDDGPLHPPARRPRVPR